MTQYIDKSALVAEIERRVKLNDTCQKISGGNEFYRGAIDEAKEILSFLDTLEVKDPYEQCIQYDSIKAGIQAHAETYSFNIESELFNQLTKEQQELWRKEIERACISSGVAGVELARDPRYKENLEVKEVNLDEKATQLSQKYFPDEENIWARANIEAHKCKSACIEMVEWFKAQKRE